MSNRTCRYKVYDIYDDSYAKVGWNGTALRDNCAIGFRGENSDSQYKICVDVQKYRIHDPDFAMEIYENEVTVKVRIQIDRSFIMT